MSSVLVTGFGGYIGPVVVRHLHDAGHAVVGLDMGFFLHCHAEPMDWPEEVAFADIRDPGDPITDIDAVVHLAGLSNDPLGDLHPNLTYRINYQATLDMIRQYPEARHVFVSSCSVYGANASLAFEDAKLNPLTAYAESKAMVDGWLGEHPEVDAVSLRLGTVYGYSPGHRTDLVVNKMVYDSAGGLPIQVNGNAARPLVHVEDVASAVVWGVNTKERGVFNVVGENWRVRDLARSIADFMGARIVSSGVGHDARDYMADASKLKGYGWTPRHTVAGSVPVLAEKTLNLPAGQYVRLVALKRLLERGVLSPDLRPTQRPPREACECKECEKVAA